eukprot:NODE_28_length_33831_cov_0.361200.p3 type:complete len:715 gc:universal NODE_28_length_33831_cov_0.361200:32831-30687(-)
MDPLFPSIANTITKASNYTRLSIRCCALLIEASIEAVRYSTEQSLKASRNLLTSAVYNPDHLERYSSLGSYVIHHAFNLAELVTMSTLNLATVTTRITSTAAEELIKLIDGLFGSTETSRALAAIIELLLKELCPENIGVLQKVALTGTITKSMVAYCLLQYNTYSRMLDAYRLTHLGYTIVDKPLNDHLDSDESILEEFNQEFSKDELSPPMEVVEDPNDEVSQFKSYLKRSSMDSLLKSPSIESLKQKSVPNIINHYEIMDKYKGTMDRQLLLDLQMYIQYSLAAYGKRFMRIFGVKKVPSVYGDICHPNHWSFAHKVNIPPQDIISSTYQESNKQGSHPIHIVDETLNSLKLQKKLEMGPVVYYLSVDHSNESVVLTFRGTMGLSDALTDFTCEYTDFNGHKVHKGILECARKLESHIIEDVKDALLINSSYNLILTGHSLGGGIAGMLAILWSDVLVNKTSKLLFNGSKTSIKCFAYGIPCIVDQALSQKCQYLITSVVHGNDMVPTLSLGLVQDLKYMIDFLGDFEPNCSEKIISHSLGLDISEKVDEEYLWIAMKGITKASKAVKLVPAGKVLWIRCRTINKRIPKSIAAITVEHPEDTAQEAATIVSTVSSTVTNYTSSATQFLSSFTNWAAHSLYPSASSTSRIYTTDAQGSSYFHETEQVLISLDQVDDVAQVFGHLTFSKTMLSDHLPIAYEDSINQLVNKMVK